MYIIIWTDNKYGVRHTEEYADIVQVRRAMKELEEANARNVQITKSPIPPHSIGCGWFTNGICTCPVSVIEHQITDTTTTDTTTNTTTGDKK